MKKLLALAALLIVSCAKDEIYEEVQMDIIPESLQMVDPVGIKLESNFVSNEALMNVKLSDKGDYTLKILDINNKVVASEKVKGFIGDNLFKVYTKVLPKSSYRLELYKINNRVGYTQINITE